MFPGVSTQIFHSEKLNEGHAMLVRDAGFDAIEVYTFPAHFDVTDSEHVRRIAAALRNTGLAARSVHAPVYDTTKKSPAKGFLSISHPIPQARQLALDRVAAAVDAAHTLGAPVVVVHFGGGGDTKHPDDPSLLFSSAVRIEALVKGTGVRVAYENICTPASLAGAMRLFLDKYEFRDAGICLDLGHANLNEHPADAVDRCGPRLLHVHAHDNNGNADEHSPPLLGSVPWGRVVNALLRASYTGCFLFETRFQGIPWGHDPELKSEFRSCPRNSKAILKYLHQSYDKILDMAAAEADTQPPDSYSDSVE